MRCSALEPRCCVTHHTSSNQNCFLCSQHQEKETSGEGRAERGSRSQNSGMDGCTDGCTDGCMDHFLSPATCILVRTEDKAANASFGNQVLLLETTAHVHAAVHQWRPCTRASVILTTQTCTIGRPVQKQDAACCQPQSHADLLLSHTLMLAPVTGLPIG